jgi:hypothetical protein
MSTAIVLAHPNISHAQAIEICRREGLRIVQTKRGNFIYLSSPAPSSPSAITPLVARGAAAGPDDEPRAA